MAKKYDKKAKFWQKGKQAGRFGKNVRFFFEKIMMKNFFNRNIKSKFAEINVSKATLNIYSIWKPEN